MDSSYSAAGGGGSSKMGKYALGAIVVAAIVIILVVTRGRRGRPDTFASEGGPAGRRLVGGEVIAFHNKMNARNAYPCADFNAGITPRGKEGFSPWFWDERANFTPNPDPEHVLPLGLDMMGVPRKFNLDTCCG